MKAKASRDRILDAAAEEFAEAGLAGARVDSIARRAGVNKAMLYYRVGGKEDLYREVLLRAQAILRAGLEADLEGESDPSKALRAYVWGFIDFARRHPEVPSIVLREVAGSFATMPEEAVDGLRGMLDILTGILERGIAEGAFPDEGLDPYSVQLTVTVAAVAASRGGPALEQMGVEPGEVAERVVEMLLRGVGCGTASRRKEER
ncbi:MAG: TetR/AcrR family transcriptional regulator [Candidatus Fermentibacteraceae bacterium]